MSDLKINEMPCILCGMVNPENRIYVAFADGRTLCDRHLKSPKSELAPASVLRAIDYECAGLKMAFDECAKEGLAGNETQRIYAANFNTLVSLREKLTAQYLSEVIAWDGPEALSRIYPQNIKPEPPERTAVSQQMKIEKIKTAIVILIVIAGWLLFLAALLSIHTR